MNEYYGAPTTPTSDYLAHYGVKGMKWGVRKAIERGNQRGLSRQFRKAEKKLAKLKAKADSQALLRKANRYDKVAKGAASVGTVGLGAAGLGTGAHMLGNLQLTKNLAKRQALKNQFINQNNAIWKAHDSGGLSNAKAKQYSDSLRSNYRANDQKLMSRTANTDSAMGIAKKVQVGGAGLAALGYGTAIGAKIRSAALKRRAANTEKMRAARQEAANFQREMNKAFAGTQYARKRRRR